MLAARCQDHLCVAIDQAISSFGVETSSLLVAGFMHRKAPRHQNLFGLRGTRGRYNPVHPQVLNHLTVVIESVRERKRCDRLLGL